MCFWTDQDGRCCSWNNHLCKHFRFAFDRYEELLIKKRYGKYLKIVESVFKDASESEKVLMAKSLKKGVSLNAFSWDGFRVVRTLESSKMVVRRDDWVTIGPTNKTALYAQEFTELESLLNNSSIKLTPNDTQELCSLMYFNWNIKSLSVADSIVDVLLERRGDFRSQKFPCQKA